MLDSILSVGGINIMIPATKIYLREMSLKINTIVHGKTYPDR